MSRDAIGRQADGEFRLILEGDDAALIAPALC